MADYQADIKENNILALSPQLLDILLMDRTLSSPGRTVNIFWATDSYAQLGDGYQYYDEIKAANITGEHGNVIVPRAVKTREQQLKRVRQKAEVFTPSWICNKQNNLVDNAWFERENVFNTEDFKTKSWTANPAPVAFSGDKTWQDYVRDTRMEITCGEAPYIASRYDTVTGEPIQIEQRIGLLDRKLRVVGENVDDPVEWLKWATVAMQNVLGYEWQGDSLLLARENMLMTFVDYFKAKFGIDPSLDSLMEMAKIISWNFWQMDGLKCVIPDSCKRQPGLQLSLFDEPVERECPACKRGLSNCVKVIREHIGTYCMIMDWGENKPIRFVSLLKG